MCVKDVARLEVQKLAQLQGSVSMQGIVEWKRKVSELLRPEVTFQFTRFPADDDLVVPSLPKPARQFQQLALAAAQATPYVHMSDLQGPGGNHE
jgi:hypothetical protein